ncbi:MAG: hypothetical protein ABIL09_27695, partial [Gemmatimonadota bacterium]
MQLARTGCAGGWSRWYPAIIAAATSAAYVTSFGGAFVFDGVQWIVENPAIRSLWPPDQVAGGTLRPVLFYTLALNYAASGLETWSYHLTNLAIHVAAALTLYGLLRRVLAMGSDASTSTAGTAAALDRAATADGPAFAAALLWALHPLQTQAVTYVIQRGESLAGLLLLLTLSAVHRGASARAPRAGRGAGRGVGTGATGGEDAETAGRTGVQSCAPGRARGWYAGAAAAFYLGLGTKEVMAAALPVLLVFDRLFLAGSFRLALRRRWGLYAAVAAPLAAAVLGSLALDPALLSGFLQGDAEDVTRWQYAASQPGVLLQYLRLAIWPFPQYLDWGWAAAASWPEVLVPAAAVLPMAVATAWGVWWGRRLAFAGAWFFLILAPTSSFVPLKDLLVEHRMYLPLAAIAALAVLAARQARARRRRAAPPRPA